jgi:hypothetical protein
MLRKSVQFAVVAAMSLSLAACPRTEDPAVDTMPPPPPPATPAPQPMPPDTPLFPPDTPMVQPGVPQP